MLDIKHEYSIVGDFKVKISNVENFQPKFKCIEFDIDVEDISTSNNDIYFEKLLKFLVKKYQEDNNLDIEEAIEYFNQTYVLEQDEKSRYIFNSDFRNITTFKQTYKTKKIGNYAFINSTMLKNFEFDDIEEIGDFAFANCPSLGYFNLENPYNASSLKLGNNLKSIGSFAFYKCNKLTTVVIPKSVESIGYGAFYGCKNLRLIIFEGKTLDEVLDGFTTPIELDSNGNAINTIMNSNGFIVGLNDVSEEQLQQLKNDLHETYFRNIEIISSEDQQNSNINTTSITVDEAVNDYPVGTKFLFDKSTREVLMVCDENFANCVPPPDPEPDPYKDNDDPPCPNMKNGNNGSNNENGKNAWVNSSPTQLSSKRQEQTIEAVLSVSQATSNTVGYNACPTGTCYTKDNENDPTAQIAQMCFNAYEAAKKRGDLEAAYDTIKNCAVKIEVHEA